MLIRCLGCNVCICLHQKNKTDKSDPYKISNWVRHVKNCDPKPSTMQSLLYSFASSTPSYLSDSSIFPRDSTLESRLNNSIEHLPSADDSSTTKEPSLGSTSDAIKDPIVDFQAFPVGSQSSPKSPHDESHQGFLPAPLSV